MYKEISLHALSKAMKQGVMDKFSIRVIDIIENYKVFSIAALDVACSAIKMSKGCSAVEARLELIEIIKELNVTEIKAEN